MDVSAITDALFIAALPQARDVGAVQALGVHLVINMIWSRPASELNRPPLCLLTLRTFDSPLLRMPLTRLRTGVEAALPVLDQGGRVLVYCRKGRHRSVAMTACILIGLGYSSNEAMDLIAARRAVADPHARHIESRIRAFESQWRSSWAALTPRLLPSSGPTSIMP